MRGVNYILVTGVLLVLIVLGGFVVYYLTSGEIVETGNKTAVLQLNNTSSPPRILELVDNSTNGELLTGQWLEVRARVFDDHNVSSVWLEVGNRKFPMKKTENGWYSVVISPEPGINHYKVVVMDNDGQTTSKSVSMSIVESWIRLYGGEKADVLGSVKKAGDGYIFAGSTLSSSIGSWDMLLVKTDTHGNVEWANAYGTTDVDQAEDVLVLDDGFLVIGQTTYAGVNNTDILVTRLDNSGNVKWTRYYGGKYNDFGKLAVKVKDGFIIFGFESIPETNNERILVMKIDEDGGLVWAKEYGKYNWYKPSDVVKLDDGFLVVGSCWNYSTSWDVLLIKLDENGKVMWTKRIGGNGYDYGNAVERYNDGFLVIGNSSSFADNYDMLVMLVDMNGTAKWTRTIGGKMDDSANSLSVTRDDAVIVGQTKSWGPAPLNPVALDLNLDKEQNISWAFVYETGDLGRLYDIIPLGSGYLMAGSTNLVNSVSDLLLIRTGKAGLLAGCLQDVSSRITLDTIYPKVMEDTVDYRDIKEELNTGRIDIEKSKINMNSSQPSCSHG